MRLAALFIKNMESHGTSHVYDGEWSGEEKQRIDALMLDWTSDWVGPGFNTWELWKRSDGVYMAKRFTWDNFDIHGRDFAEFIEKIDGYYNRMAS